MCYHHMDYSQSRKLAKLEIQSSHKCFSGMLKLIAGSFREFAYHIPLICLALRLLPENVQKRLAS